MLASDSNPPHDGNENPDNNLLLAPDDNSQSHCCGCRCFGQQKPVHQFCKHLLVIAWLILDFVAIGVGQGQTCASPLLLWVIVKASSKVFFFMISFIAKRYLSAYRGTSVGAKLRRMFVISTIIYILATFIWFIFGNIWLGTSKDCIRTSPILFWVVLSHTVYSHVMNCIVFAVLIGLYRDKDWAYFCCGVNAEAVRYRRGLEHDIPQPVDQKILDTFPVYSYHVTQGEQIDESNTNTDGEIGESDEPVEIGKPLLDAVCEVMNEGMVVGVGEEDHDESESDDDGDVCGICLVNYMEGDLIRSLPCDHEFHRDCVDTWFQKRRTCPFCRVDVTIQR